MFDEADIRKFEVDVKSALQSFVVSRGLTRHQIESYEHFVHVMIPQIIEENNPLVIHCPKQHVCQRLTFDNIRFRKPTIRESNGSLRYLYPKEAHLRRQSYSFDVIVDISHRKYTSSSANPKAFSLTEYKVYKAMVFARIPAMLGSSVCNDCENFASPFKNQFGMFICNGYTKTLISQERLRTNKAFIHAPKRLTKNRKVLRCEIRSVHSSKIRSTSTLNIFVNDI